MQTFLEIKNLKNLKSQKIKKIALCVLLEIVPKHVFIRNQVKVLIKI